MYDSRSARIDPEVKRSKVKVIWLRKPSQSYGYMWDHAGPRWLLWPLCYCYRRGTARRMTA